MSIKNGRELGEKLVEILGLPKTTKGFELRCYVDEVVSVKCVYYPDINNSDDLIEVLHEYELVKKE